MSLETNLLNSLVEHEILCFLDNYGHLPLEEPPVLVFPRELASVIRRCKHIFSQYGFVMVFTQLDDFEVIAVGRLYHIKRSLPSYAEIYDEQKIKYFADKTKRIFPSSKGIGELHPAVEKKIIEVFGPNAMVVFPTKCSKMEEFSSRVKKESLSNDKDDKSEPVYTSYTNASDTASWDSNINGMEDKSEVAAIDDKDTLEKRIASSLKVENKSETVSLDNSNVISKTDKFKVISATNTNVSRSTRISHLIREGFKNRLFADENHFISEMSNEKGIESAAKYLDNLFGEETSQLEQLLQSMLDTTQKSDSDDIMRKTKELDIETSQLSLLNVRSRAVDRELSTTEQAEINKSTPESLSFKLDYEFNETPESLITLPLRKTTTSPTYVLEEQMVPTPLFNRTLSSESTQEMSIEDQSINFQSDAIDKVETKTTTLSKLLLLKKKHYSMLSDNYALSEEDYFRSIPSDPIFFTVPETPLSEDELSEHELFEDELVSIESKVKESYSNELKTIRQTFDEGMNLKENAVVFSDALVGTSIPKKEPELHVIKEKELSKLLKPTSVYIDIKNETIQKVAALLKVTGTYEEECDFLDSSKQILEIPVLEELPSLTKELDGSVSNNVRLERKSTAKTATITKPAQLKCKSPTIYSREVGLNTNARSTSSESKMQNRKQTPAAVSAISDSLRRISLEPRKVHSATKPEKNTKAFDNVLKSNSMPNFLKRIAPTSKLQQMKSGPTSKEGKMQEEKQKPTAKFNLAEFLKRMSLPSKRKHNCLSNSEKTPTSTPDLSKKTQQTRRKIEFNRSIGSTYSESKLQKGKQTIFDSLKRKSLQPTKVCSNIEKSEERKRTLTPEKKSEKMSESQPITSEDLKKSVQSTTIMHTTKPSLSVVTKTEMRKMQPTKVGSQLSKSASVMDTTKVLQNISISQDKTSNVPLFKKSTFSSRQKWQTKRGASNKENIISESSKMSTGKSTSTTPIIKRTGGNKSV